MKGIVAFIMLSAVLSAQSTSEAMREQSRIIALENAWDQAVEERDSQALEMILAPELVYVEYDGSLMGKAQYLAAIRSPMVRPARVASDSMTVHIYGDIALVTGVYRESGVKEGRSYTLHERFTDTWIRRAGSWMCLASQSTLILH
jgi:ketosteroid isomerase-like protein